MEKIEKFLDSEFIDVHLFKREFFVAKQSFAHFTAMFIQFSPHKRDNYYSEKFRV